MLAAWIVSALGMAFGAYLGLRGLLDPRWASRLVRLKEDEQGGGFAEFRATYGGVFLGLHAAGLALTLQYLRSGHEVIGVAATGAVAALAFGWAGAAFGRLVSMWRDAGTATPFNRLSVGVETALALAIGAPWALWLLGA
jgi:hypothetical protein